MRSPWTSGWASNLAALAYILTTVDVMVGGCETSKMFQDSTSAYIKYLLREAFRGAMASELRELEYHRLHTHECMVACLLEEASPQVDVAA